MNSTMRNGKSTPRGSKSPKIFSAPLQFYRNGNLSPGGYSVSSPRSDSDSLSSRYISTISDKIHHVPSSSDYIKNLFGRKTNVNVTDVLKRMNNLIKAHKKMVNCYEDLDSILCNWGDSIQDENTKSFLNVIGNKISAQAFEELEFSKRLISMIAKFKKLSYEERGLKNTARLLYKKEKTFMKISTTHGHNDLRFMRIEADLSNLRAQYMVTRAQYYTSVKLTTKKNFLGYFNAEGIKCDKLQQIAGSGIDFISGFDDSPIGIYTDMAQFDHFSEIINDHLIDIDNSEYETENEDAQIINSTSLDLLGVSENFLDKSSDPDRIPTGCSSSTIIEMGKVQEDYQALKSSRELNSAFRNGDIRPSSLGVIISNTSNPSVPASRAKSMTQIFTSTSYEEKFLAGFHQDVTSLNNDDSDINEINLETTLGKQEITSTETMQYSEISDEFKNEFTQSPPLPFEQETYSYNKHDYCPSCSYSLNGSSKVVKSELSGLHYNDAIVSKIIPVYEAMTPVNVLSKRSIPNLKTPSPKRLNSFIRKFELGSSCIPQRQAGMDYDDDMNYNDAFNEVSETRLNRLSGNPANIKKNNLKEEAYLCPPHGKLDNETQEKSVGPSNDIFPNVWV